MGGDGEFEELIVGALLQADMATFLTDDNPAVPLQGAKYFVEIETGDFAHMAISSCSVSGAK